MPMRAPLALAIAALAAVIAPAAPAAACSCAMPSIRISPRGAGAPINATVMAWLPHGGYGAFDKVTLSLREKRSGAPVAVAYRSAGSADVGVVELVPRHALRPNTSYEVIAAHDAALDVVGTFTTGGARATTAPAWKGVVKAGYFRAVPRCCLCMTRDPYLELRLTADDHQPLARSLAAIPRYAIWVADRNGKLDYSRPPVTYLAGGTAWLSLGHPSTCSPDNFTIPHRKALKLGIRPVDLAGNLGAPSELVLDTVHAKRP